MDPLLLTYGLAPNPTYGWRSAGDPTETAIAPVVATSPTMVVIAEERSVFDANAPTYRAILAAMQGASLPADQGGGVWVGPGPRVTRTSKPGERFGTFAAWVYQWPTAPTPAVVDALKGRVKAALDGVTAGWQDVAISTYNEGVNGSIDWWRCASGGTVCAQITHTRDEFPFFAGRLDPEENHVGPTSSATHPTTVQESLQGAADATKSAVWWALGITAALGTGYVGVKWYEASQRERR